MKSPIAIKKEPLALIKNLILAEILIGVFIIVLVVSTNLEAIYYKMFGASARFDYFLVISSSVLQIVSTLIVFLRWHSKHYEKRLSILDLILSGESQNLELKQTFRWDVKEKTLNKGLEKTVMKSIAGFLNSEGGKIILGVADNKSIFGLEQDYQTLARSDRDGFENHFSQTFNSIIGVRFRRFLKISFEKIDNKDVCLIEVYPSSEPVYININNSEEFFIRSGNTTSPLPVSKVTDYIKSRWQ